MIGLAAVVSPHFRREILDWARACTDRPSGQSMLAIQTYVDLGKEAGWFDVLPVHRTFCADTPEAARRCLKDPTKLLSSNGAWTHAPGFGVQGDFATGYLGEGRTAAQMGMSIDNHCALAYGQTDLAGSTGEFGAAGGTGRIGARARGISGTLMSVWSSSGVPVQVGVTTARGLFGVRRSASAQLQGVKDDSSTDVLSASSAMPTTEFTWLRLGLTATYGRNQLAWGVGGPDLADESWSGSIGFAIERVLTLLDTLVPQEPSEPPGNNCWPRSTNDLLAPTKMYFAQITLPADDTADNVPRYTATSSAIVFVADAHTTGPADLGVTLLATTGATAKTVTLMSAVTAGATALQVVRKVDAGAGTCTVNGVVLAEIWDTVIFVSDGTSWIYTPDYAPLTRATVIFPAKATWGRPWAGNASSTQTEIDFYGFLWIARALGPEAGTIVNARLKANDVMQVITLSSGVQARVEFDSYLQAITEGWCKQLYDCGALPRDDVRVTDLPLLGNRPAGWGFLDVADAGGFDTSGWAPYVASNDTATLYGNVDVDLGDVGHHAWFDAHKDTIFTQPAVGGTFMAVRNKVVLGLGRLCDIPSAVGYWFDQEIGDFRGPTLFEATMRGHIIIANAFGYKTLLDGQTIGSGAWANSGGTQANALALLSGPNSLDYINIRTHLTPPNGDQEAFIQAQIDYLDGADRSKIIVAYGIGGRGAELPIEDAALVHDLIQGPTGLGGAYRSNFYSKPGGRLELPVNQIVATVCGLPTS